MAAQRDRQHQGRGGSRRIVIIVFIPFFCSTRAAEHSSAPTAYFHRRRAQPPLGLIHSEPKATNMSWSWREIDVKMTIPRQMAPTFPTPHSPKGRGRPKSKTRPPWWATSISPNGHFWFVPESDKLYFARTQMSVALVSSSAPQPRDHIYNGSWPFRESKDGPPTRILSNCCNRVTARQSLAVKIASPASPRSAARPLARTVSPQGQSPPQPRRPQSLPAIGLWTGRGRYSSGIGALPSADHSTRPLGLCPVILLSRKWC